MMRDVIERFRYRFGLWRRGQREAYFGPLSRTESPEERDYISDFSDPKRAVLLTESTFVSIGRAGAAYFGIIAISAYVCVIIAKFVPFLRFAIGVVLVAFVVLWTLVAILFEIDLRKARKQYRQREASKSSNQLLQLTADRPDDQPSIHETAFTPKMPRFRQR